MIDDKGWGSPTVTKDGVTIAEEIELTDPYENMGAQLVKEAALEDVRRRRRRRDDRHRPGRGDLQGGPQGPRRRQPDAMSLKRGIDKAVAAVVENVKAQSKTVGDKEIHEVATIAANNAAATIGEKLADAFKAGPARTASSRSRRARASG